MLTSTFYRKHFIYILVLFLSIPGCAALNIKTRFCHLFHMAGTLTKAKSLKYFTIFGIDWQEKGIHWQQLTEIKQKFIHSICLSIFTCWKFLLWAGAGLNRWTYFSWTKTREYDLSKRWTISIIDVLQPKWRNFIWFRRHQILWFQGTSIHYVY